MNHSGKQRYCHKLNVRLFVTLHGDAARTSPEVNVVNVNWPVVATIAAPIIALFVGVWINRRFESRPNLISYYGHVSAFRGTAQDGTPFPVHTHSVVLRNAGRRSATNVRLRHNVLPDFNIFPPLVYRVDQLGDGVQEIVIPTLVPNEEITVSYLYFPPLIAMQINSGIKCDQGFALAIPVLLQRQYPRWFNSIAAVLMFVGLVALIYLAISAAVAITQQ